MSIAPSYFAPQQLKDMIYFYTVLISIPLAVITAIINIRANPELTEIPEGYEPRHWEYYRNPVARFMAKHMFMPNETDVEMLMSMEGEKAENIMLNKIRRNVDKVMSFYSDHRSSYFVPYFGEYIRRGRDDFLYGQSTIRSLPNLNYEDAYDPEIRIVPVEGYHIRPE